MLGWNEGLGEPQEVQLEVRDGGALWTLLRLCFASRRILIPTAPLKDRV